MEPKLNLYGRLLSISICFASALIFLVGNSDAEQAGCLEAAQNSLGLRLSGGWQPHEDFAKEGKDLKKVVTHFIQRALEDINAKSNDMKFYTLAKVNNEKKRVHPIVYTQVVAGTNYCIQFEAQAAGCKNANKADVCTEGTMTCSFEAYQPLILNRGAPAEPEIGEVLCD